jgi:hypothetical protein
MLCMTLLTVTDKAAALGKLYDSVARIAKEMGGTATHQVRELNVPAIAMASHQSEDVPVLIAEMPDSFLVEFAPTFPLSIKYATSVRAVRTHDGERESNWAFYWSDGWRRTQSPLSADEIRECLTPERPHPAKY